MTKTKENCPLCEGQFIVVKINRLKQEAWPSCFDCGFEGHSEGETKALVVELQDDTKDEKLILEEAFDNWISYLLLLKEEEAIKEKEKTSG